MRNKVLLVLSGALALANGAWAAELNTLSGLQVVPTGGGTQVVVRGNHPPTFTVFRMAEPDRLVVDLSSADSAGIKGHHDGAGPVSGVVASQFNDDKSSVARLMVALDGATKYNVRADGNRVVIQVDGKATAGKSPAALAAAAVAQAPKATGAKPAAPNGDPNVLSSSEDARTVSNPAKRLQAVTFSNGELRVLADGEIARYKLVELDHPRRIALDVFGVKGAPKAPKGDGRFVSDVRVGPHADKVRIVMDLAKDDVAYKVSWKKRGLGVLLRSKASVATEVAEAAVSDGDGADAEAVIDGKPVALENAPMLATAAPSTSSSVSKGPAAEVKDLSFDENPNGGIVQLKLSRDVAFKVERPNANGAVLTLENVKLPKKLERSLDTSALETPVKMVSAFSVPGEGNKVRIVVASSESLKEAVSRTASGLTWRIDAGKGRPEVATSNSKAAPLETEATNAIAQATLAQQGAKYRGKRVSFEFKDIDIHNLLRVIAEVSKKNIVVADDVSGKVTIRLRNVPWDQALDLVLRSKQLGKEEFGNIVRVAPLKALEEEAKLRAERQKSLMAQAPLLVQLLPVNYATAADMQTRVKDILSERGSVSVDTRTNVLIVKDVDENIRKARALVQNLDTQTPQVLIESRIVEASTNFTRQIGVQWGGSATASPATGNPTGLAFPYVAGVRGGSDAAGNAGTSDTPDFAVNLPAAVGQGSGGALGFVFGSAGGAVALNLRLSASEAQGNVKTISAPKVTTLDNNTARISQGVSIPFSQVSAAGVNTTFVEARLSLEVTPHITQDGSILMAIRAENNQPDPSNTGANGQPSIQRKEANTQVLVKDGDTTVIGGIYVRRGAQNEQAVPFLSRIPVLGFFFRNSSESDARQELLIFITPRIINRQQVAQTY